MNNIQKLSNVKHEYVWMYKCDAYIPTGRPRWKATHRLFVPGAMKIKGIFSEKGSVFCASLIFIKKVMSDMMINPRCIITTDSRQQRAVQVSLSYLFHGGKDNTARGQVFHRVFEVWGPPLWTICKTGSPQSHTYTSPDWNQLTSLLVTFTSDNLWTRQWQGADSTTKLGVHVLCCLLSPVSQTLIKSLTPHRGQTRSRHYLLLVARDSLMKILHH